MKSKEEQRWERIQAFIQEVGMVSDYLHWRVLCKLSEISGGQPPEAESPVFGMTADSEGELTEEAIIRQFEAIARQAHAGFVDGPDFPVFGSLEHRHCCNC